ncbi:MAG TPA: metal ABC transporter permease [Thermoleophilaceae bacterium]
MRIDELFQFHFMTNALIAGTIVAVTASAIGWFVVVRQQAFAGHTLSVIAFPGAAAAALAGAPVVVGYFAACALGALALAAVTGGEARSISHESAAIGSVQALALGLGFLFVSLYHGLLTELNSLLFGTFLGITDTQVLVLLGVGAGVLLMLALVARPLLFASVDADVARAGGVPVAALSTVFLMMLGLAVAATSQITGALLVFALLVTPPATAQLITPHPGRSFALSVVIALLVTWLGLSIAYFSIYPVGFYVTSLSFGLYVLVRLVRR